MNNTRIMELKKEADALILKGSTATICGKVGFQELDSSIREEAINNNFKIPKKDGGMRTVYNWVLSFNIEANKANNKCVKDFMLDAIRYINEKSTVIEPIEELKSIKDGDPVIIPDELTRTRQNPFRYSIKFMSNDYGEYYNINLQRSFFAYNKESNKFDLPNKEVSYYLLENNGLRKPLKGKPICKGLNCVARFGVNENKDFINFKLRDSVTLLEEPENINDEDFDYSVYRSSIKINEEEESNSLTDEIPF